MSSEPPYSQPASPDSAKKKGCSTLTIVLCSIGGILLLLIGGCFAVGIYGIKRVTKEVQLQVEAKKKTEAERVIRTEGIEVEGFTSRSFAGTDSMEADFRIVNRSTHDREDIVLRFDYFGPDGDHLEHRDLTVPGILKANDSREFKGFLMTAPAGTVECEPSIREAKEVSGQSAAPPTKLETEDH